MKPGFFLLLLFFFAAGDGLGQSTPRPRFGKLTPADFKDDSFNSSDSSAGAVIIADIGSTEIVGNDKSGFSLEFNTYRRARILNRNGFGIAVVEIPVYTDGDLEEDLRTIRAVTYNLENGRVVQTRVNPRKSVFKNRIDKNRIVRRFTFPNVKEGSIIEYEYRLKSDFMFNLRAWDFQGAYPVRWSEYKVAIPEFYNYVILSQGYQPFSFKDQREKRETFVVDQGSQARGGMSTSNGRVTFTAAVMETRWVMQQMPALREENYTSTLRNHISRVEFQLAELREPVFSPKKYLNTWEDIAADLINSEDFGYPLDNNTGWLGSILVGLGASPDSLSAARKIYRYVQDNMTCTNYNRIKLEGRLEAIARSRSGSVAAINLFLTALLRKAGFRAEPVILSTRSHGYVFAKYPLMDRFNYVITRLTLDSHSYYLDASRSGLGFGRLSFECYNGHARIVNPEATAVDLVPDSVVERKQVTISLVNRPGGGMRGTTVEAPGYFESYSLRSMLKERGEEQLYLDINRNIGVETVVRDLHIDSLQQYEEPLVYRYHFDLDTGTPEMLYINPMLGEGWRSNPFQSTDRFYPVEMPYAIDETYTLRLDIPDGYSIEELPDPVVVRLNDADEGHFEYRVLEVNGVISLRSRVRISRAFFLPEEYEMLREFFNLVVAKHNEQIVFRKKQ